MTQRLVASSPWAPLRVTVFRWLWLASLVSNFGTWMQTVGAQWLLVHAAHAAILVSLVQTADMLPDVLFGIVGGGAGGHPGPPPVPVAGSGGPAVPASAA